MTNRRTRSFSFVAAGAALAAALGSASVARGDTVIAAAADLGITPESLAVLDLQEWSSTILGNLAQASTLRETVDAKAAAATAASSALGELTARAQCGGESGSMAQAVAAAVAAFETARQELGAARADLRDAALNGCAGNAGALLDAWTAKNGRHVPREFKAVERTAEQWDQIERALRAEIRALNRNEALDEAAAALLASIREDQAVEAAAGRLATDLATTSAAFAGFAE